MAYNPALPADHSLESAAEMRSQLTALKALIDTVPSSPAVAAAVTQQVSVQMSGIEQLTLTISNPPTQAQVQAILNQLNLVVSRLALPL